MKEKTKAFYKTVFKYWWNERTLKRFRRARNGRNLMRLRYNTETETMQAGKWGSVQSEEMPSMR
jgi:hypothetical protein